MMSDSPQVSRYLSELDQALQAKGVHDAVLLRHQLSEHIDDALADDPQPSEPRVRQVLADLGDPLRLAHDAALSQQTFGMPAGDERIRPSTGGWLSDDRLPPIACGVLILAMVVSLGAVFGLQGAPVSTGFGATVALLNPMWWVPAIVVGLSPLFQPIEKVLCIATVPVVIVVELAIQGGNLLNSVNDSTAIPVKIVAFALPVLAIRWLIVVSRSASRRPPRTASRSSR